jgi:hypothetical protein
MGTAKGLSLALQLVEAGFELTKIVEKAHAMEAEGRSSSEITKWLKEERDQALSDLVKSRRS